MYLSIPPGRPTDELLLAASIKTYSDSHSLFVCGNHQFVKWSHYQKWMSHFLHLHRTSFQVKYPLDLLGLYGQVSVIITLCVFFFFPDERHTGQDVRVYHIHSPFSPPPPPPSFCFSPGVGCSTQTQSPLPGTCPLTTSASILNT